MPRPDAGTDAGEGGTTDTGQGEGDTERGVYNYSGPDTIAAHNEHQIGFQGMKVDRMFFERFEDKVYPAFGMSDFKAVPPAWRTLIPEYVKDYVPLNQFM